MYTEVNGQRKPITLHNKQMQLENFAFAAAEGYNTTPVGSNKGWLIAALIVSILAVIVSGYLLYKNISAEKNGKESFGYHLY